MPSRCSGSEVYARGHVDSSSAAFAPQNCIRPWIGSADKLSNAKRAANHYSLSVGPLRHKESRRPTTAAFDPLPAFARLWGEVAQ